MADEAQLLPCAINVGVINQKAKVVRILYSKPQMKLTRVSCWSANSGPRTWRGSTRLACPRAARLFSSITSPFRITSAGEWNGFICWSLHTSLVFFNSKFSTLSTLTQHFVNILSSTRSVLCPLCRFLRGGRDSIHLEFDVIPHQRWGHRKDRSSRATYVNRLVKER